MCKHRSALRSSGMLQITAGWTGNLGGNSRPGPAYPAALTRGPGGVAQRCGSSWPAAAAATATTAGAEAGTHHAAALMAGPEQAACLGSGRSHRANRREVAAQHTPELRTVPGEPGCATPGSEPGGGGVSGVALAQFRLFPLRIAERGA